MNMHERRCQANEEYQQHMRQHHETQEAQKLDTPAVCKLKWLQSFQRHQVSMVLRIVYCICGMLCVVQHTMISNNAHLDSFLHSYLQTVQQEHFIQEEDCKNDSLYIVFILFYSRLSAPGVVLVFFSMAEEASYKSFWEHLSYLIDSFVSRMP